MMAAIITQIAIAMCAVVGEFLSPMQVAQANAWPAWEAQTRALMAKNLAFI
jgi:hypothetical protein